MEKILPENGPQRYRKWCRRRRKGRRRRGRWKRRMMIIFEMFAPFLPYCIVVT
jgi:hypothetical protein